MTDLRGLTFSQPAIIGGIADLTADERVALGVLIDATPDRVADDLLEYDLAGVDLADVRAGVVPLLIEHRWSLDYLAGQVVDCWLDDGALMAALRFARSGEGDRLWSLLTEGFPLSLSIGSKAVASSDIGPSPWGGRHIKVSRWKLAEVSIVVRGQRPEARVRLIGREHVERLIERMPAAEDAARLAIRRHLQLDRWERWAMTAGIRLAREFDLDLDRFGDALAREVAEHASTLERDGAVPRLEAVDRAA